MWTICGKVQFRICEKKTEIKMFEFEIEISLFVAPFLEAEQAGEPKTVKRGSWLLIRSQDQN